MHPDVPFPDLRILPVENIFPHEEHDSQRSTPLLERIQQAEWFTNPPVVAPMDDGNFVILDGANRYSTFSRLGYPHLLVQVMAYDSGFVELGVWNHIVSQWNQVALLQRLRKLSGVKFRRGWDANAAAQVLMQNGRVFSIHATTQDIQERNATLREVVRCYQQNAVLNRTVMTDTLKLWQLYPDAVALVLFPEYSPNEIIRAARDRAYLPPGITRHIIQGRSLKLNYPLAELRDRSKSLEEKNEALQSWLRERLANRGVRYYAESTYQFDE